MPAPKADPPRCDLLGCGLYATVCTDGSETDVQGLGRPALPLMNVCDRHQNWPHSDDARVFALSDVYRKRVADAGAAAPKGAK